MNPVDNIKRAIQRLHMTTSSETDKRILDDAYAALDRSFSGSGQVSGCVWHSVLKRKAKDLVPVSVVILVVFTLFFCTLNTQAVVLEDIYNALGQVRNVCITCFRANDEESYQKSWISRPSRLRLLEDRNLAVLWDLNSWARIEKDINNGSINQSPVEPDLHEKIEKSMSTSFGLIPFSDILEAKTKGRWERVVDKSITDVSDGIELYDLTWTGETSGDITVYHKWRVFVDIKTDLPVKTQWYQKIDSDEEYRHTTTSIITYPSDDQIETIINETFGSSLNQLNRSEDFSIPQISQIDAGIIR